MANQRPRRSARRPSRAPAQGLDLVVVGHTNLDHFFRVQHLPDVDRTVPLRDREVRLGGTAANIARVAAKLGVRTALASRVGPDFPPRFRQVLAQEGIDLSGFESVAGARSPAAFIVESAGGEQVTLLDQGPMEGDDGTTVSQGLLSRAGWVHLATGNPNYQLRVLDAVRRLGLRAVADPAQEIFYRWEPAPLRQLLSGCELFFANRNELARALELLRLTKIRELLRVVPMVVETMGPLGARAFTRAGRAQVSASSTHRARQVTGAGDAFRGGFYAGWFRGDPLRDCLRYGAWAAARWLESGDPSALYPFGARPHPPADLSKV
jgi:nucleoside kinase